jgi:DNA-binding NtrC family response regulator/tetratricopeptide (TPR) repeat protein
VTTNSESTLKALVGIGRFAEALRLLQERIAGSKPTTELSLLEAELLEKLGAAAEAEGRATALLKRPGLSSAERSRCHLILGNESRDRGLLKVAVNQYQRALALAQQAEDRRQEVWALLRLLLAYADSGDLGAFAGILATVRKNIIALADPQLLTALHLFVAEAEAKRGLAENARHHIRVARRLLGTSPDLWLQGTADNGSFCVNYTLSDFKSALTDAQSALSVSAVSGHLAARRAALANLGHVYLVAADFEKALECLDTALSMCPVAGETRASILDGLAQLALATGQVSNCDTMLKAVEVALKGHPSPCSQSEMWSSVTRGRLLLAVGRGTEVVGFCDRTIAALPTNDDKSLSIQLQLIRAAGLVACRELKLATQAVVLVAQKAPNASMEIKAGLARVTGGLLREQGELGRAQVWFGRASRIFECIGHRLGRDEVRRDSASLCAGKVAVTDSLSEPETGGSGDTTAEIAVDRLSALFDLAAYPDLLGHEVLNLLLDTKAVSSGEIIAVDAVQEQRSHVAHACTEPDSGHPNGTEKWQIELGDRGGRTFYLLVEPSDRPSGSVTLQGAQKLVQAARALEAVRLERLQEAALWPIEIRPQTYRGVFVSRQMQELVSLARKIVDSDATVLLTGETGTGKEVVARMIHDESSRAGQPFVPFNCSSFSSDTVESQLFGYRKGAFTGADSSFSGVIRAATGGTLFLDEVGDLPVEVQPKLLRFLESGEIHPLGDPRPVRSNVRILAATNVDLGQMAKSGAFREDLYYRLNVIPVVLPPLRERREEIPLLFEHYLHQFCASAGKERLRLAQETMEYLVLYGWPGNVRQLVNEVKRLVALGEPGAVLMPEHLSPDIVASRRTLPVAQRVPTSSEVLVRLDQTAAAAHDHLDRAQIAWAMKASGNRVEAAAMMLGVSRKGLYLKRQRLGLGVSAKAEQPSA